VRRRRRGRRSGRVDRRRLPGEGGTRRHLLQRERFPRFHVGESLLPASLSLFDRLGVREQIESAGFQRKNGAVFADETEHRG
jgi:FADH2-dependent halogenase